MAGLRRNALRDILLTCRHAALRHVSCLHQSVEYDRESRQPFDTPDAKSVGGRAASGRAEPAC
ncbi:hypothetical protein BCPG_02551 [Burkholderia cenocepacia PC184]|nr:hypothetical protein BCPG_02551 [Burkholderia cenocepacia PC184]